MSSATCAASAANLSAQPHAGGSTAWWRATWAAATGGFATFSLLYGVQPLMPMLAAHYGLSPAASSGVLSVATLPMALMLIPASLLAERFGRTRMMVASLFLGVLLSWCAAFSDSYGWLLLWRGLFGVVMAGLPALALSYLSEELEPGSLGRSVGLYIAGNALGGMSGRYLASVVADAAGLQNGMLAQAVLGTFTALLFWKLLPESRRFVARQVSLRGVIADSRQHWRDAGLARLFVLGFMLMGGFVSLYNYLGFRLQAAPFALSQSTIGLIFLLYVVGMAASTVAGRMADRLGRREVLWKMVALMLPALALTLANSLWLVVIGVGLFTFGFFAAHAVAASWVGRRASHARGLASAFYLTSYYVGSALIGSGSGLMWRLDGWLGVAGLIAALLALCLWLTWQLRSVEPLQPASH
ncbi:MFS transporter [Vogesella oryzae]|uniref:MFS transporter n=1 Tax=Vogesella oryzae TaxID=1735285 RepID=UPI0015816A90|nr:MFS transporter [Vogesella oryzae]